MHTCIRCRILLGSLEMRYRISFFLFFFSTVSFIFCDTVSFRLYSNVHCEHCFSDCCMENEYKRFFFKNIYIVVMILLTFEIYADIYCIMKPVIKSFTVILVLFFFHCVTVNIMSLCIVSLDCYTINVDS